MTYSDSHVEYIHHPRDLQDLTNPEFLTGQINADLINQVQPNLLFLAIYVDSGEAAWERLLWVLEAYKKDIAHNGWITVLSREDLNRDGIKIILHVEDLHAIGDDLSKVEELYRLGVRSIGLTHNQLNQCAGGSLEREKGLTELGKQAIKKITVLGMVFDWAHLGPQSFRDALEVTDVPPFISHAGVFGAFVNPRNVSDEVLTAIRERDGYIGLGLAGSFLGESTATQESYLTQIRHAESIVGASRVGVGSDLGGIISFLPEGLNSIADISQLENVIENKAFFSRNLVELLGRSSLR